ncbi:MAG: TrbG/VirB9 family P-type conjugative transfer protein [Chloroflexota bacterium]|nr:TrbG/VirB9 family P-type conjugative transfer protein [Chloroflexota bacterium]
MKTVVLGGLTALWLSHSALSVAETMPVRGSVDSRIRAAIYNAEEVYRLVGFVGYHLDLEFEADETFTGISAGDPEALTYSAHANVLTLRPRVEVAQMNLTVSTTKRRYYFEYSIAARRPDRAVDEVMYAVRFSYPEVAGDVLTPEQRIALELAKVATSRPRNVDYWFCGSPAVKPVRASDDGVHTRLTFAANAELPALFVRNDDGTESLLNFSVDAGDVVIHRVAERFIVRRGKLTGCIVNKGFAGSGVRLESGTVTPEVVRERKSAAP